MCSHISDRQGRKPGAVSAVVRRSRRAVVGRSVADGRLFDPERGGGLEMLSTEQRRPNSAVRGASSVKHTDESAVVASGAGDGGFVAPERGDGVKKDPHARSYP